jgi:hypothetical protein
VSWLCRPSSGWVSRHGSTRPFSTPRGLSNRSPLPRIVQASSDHWPLQICKAAPELHSDTSSTARRSGSPVSEVSRQVYGVGRFLPPSRTGSYPESGLAPHSSNMSIVFGYFTLLGAFGYPKISCRAIFGTWLLGARPAAEGFVCLILPAAAGFLWQGLLPRLRTPCLPPSLVSSRVVRGRRGGLAVRRLLQIGSSLLAECDRWRPGAGPRSGTPELQAFLHRSVFRDCVARGWPGPARR